MKKMIINDSVLNRIFYTKRYINGQLAVFIQNKNGEPIAELSIMKDSVELAPNEFILKCYSENKELAQECLRYDLFASTDRFVLIGSHLCPVCKIYQER